MELVSETVIDEVIDELNETQASLDRVLDQLQVEQPVLVAFLASENFDLFTDQERDFMLYLLLVIWQSVRKVRPDLPAVTEKALVDAEERNWEKMQGIKAGRFHERLDPFFKGYEQEDLLAFVEDALLEEEEEDVITREGREPLFISLKSVIDCLVV